MSGRYAWTQEPLMNQPGKDQVSSSKGFLVGILLQPILFSAARLSSAAAPIRPLTDLEELTNLSSGPLLG